MSGLTRSLSDVPEEGRFTPTSPHPEDSPYSNNPAASSTATLGQPPTSTAGSSSRTTKTRSPSIRTLGRQSTDASGTTGASSVSGSGSGGTSISSKRPSSGTGSGSSSKDPRRKAAAAGSSQSSQPVRRIQSIPSLPHDKQVEPAPSTAMYWSRAPVYGTIPQRTMRAHTTTLVDTTAWFFGGNDDKEIVKDMKDVYCFDIETMQWTQRETTGEIPPPCRAHTATLVDRKLIVFGGGQGVTYYDKVYVLDTTSRNWTRPAITGPVPACRRAHSAVHYQGKVWIFGGGTGMTALSDVWTLDVSSFTSMKWEEVKTTGRTPNCRGYHSANLVGNMMIVVGGSDGKDFFTDVWCLDLDKRAWSQVQLGTTKYKRIAHSATQIGSFLYITGGFNGEEYCSDVLPFNLVSLQYEPRVTYGKPPSGRGYHSTILADSRLFLFGGYDGSMAYDDVYILDLAAGAYLPQVTSFNIDLNA
ncbi:Tip elongation aberrant protein 1 [Hypsizygus marmoreus]|uniref:Tip elongation aberrant protein 1 n=1 Tax=Hypsizygus marmoreus TaxID=39966 RepID=A0A369J1U8_HYPMA|nr:Tip elongation aberrant protein 1 [Hypsizygus marmoreus]